jgi:hypothetical protein
MSVADPEIDTPMYGARDSMSSECGSDQLGVSHQPLPSQTGVLDQDRADLLDVPLGPVLVLGLRGVVEVHVGAGGSPGWRGPLEDVGGVVARGAPAGGDDLDCDLPHDPPPLEIR